VTALQTREHPTLLYKGRPIHNSERAHTDDLGHEVRTIQQAKTGKAGGMRNRLLCACVLVVGVRAPLAAQESPQPQAEARGSFGSSAQVDDSTLPVGSLGALSSRVKRTSRIYVQKTDGEELSARFLSASDLSLTLEIEGQTRDIPASEVRQVTQRGGNRIRKGMAFGFLAGAAVGSSALAASGSDSDYSVGDRIFVGILAGGGTGLVWGAIIGAFLHERPVVYLAPVPTVRLLPAFSPHSVGVVLRAQF